MRLLSWNVNGLRSVLGKGFFEFLAAADADIVCLQEIKAQPAQVEWALPAGYVAYWNAAGRPGYSGTLTLSKIAPLDLSSGIGHAVGDGEGRVQTLEFPDFYLINVYTPNSGRDLSRLEFRTREWDPAFRQHCVGLAAKKPVVFCGDLNVAHREIDLANPKTNRKNAGFTDAEREQFEAHLEAGFIDSFRTLHPDAPGHYSWWSFRPGVRQRNIGWRIDYFCLSPVLRPHLRDAFIWPHILGSDHCPIGIVLNP